MGTTHYPRDRFTNKDLLFLPNKACVSRCLSFIHRNIIRTIIVPCLIEASVGTYYSKKVYKNFTNFTGKHVLESNFSSVAALFTEHLQWMLLHLSGQPMLCELNWYVETPAQVFSYEVCKISKNIIDHLSCLLLSVTRCITSNYTTTATSNRLIFWC